MGVSADAPRDELARLWKLVGIALFLWVGLMAGFLALGQSGHVAAAEFLCLPLVPASVWLALGSVAAGFHTIARARHARRNGRIRGGRYASLVGAGFCVPLVLLAVCGGTFLMVTGLSRW